MRSPGISERFPLFKTFAALLSLLFVILISSCSQDQSAETMELPPDSEITDTIEAQLEATEQVPHEAITVSTKEGIVTLSGNTENLLAKREAKKIAQATFGVLSVVNNLKTTLTRPDRQIQQDVNSALSTDAAIEPLGITAEVENGSVTLTGRADSWQEKHLAENVAAGVKGVKSITNHINVVHSGNRSDDEIAAEIENSLKMDARVDADMVSVNVSDGAAELSGAIGSAYEKSLAQDIARVAGVRSVDADRLEVHPEYESSLFRNKEISGLTDSQIRDAIVSAFTYDPRVPEEKVSVSVENGTAILEGTVLNLNSKLAAERDARNTAGISEVTNEISVERKVVVKPEVPTTDQALAQRLKYSIERDPYVDKTAVTVSVEEGVASIEGTVNSRFEKEQLRKIAGDVKGIILVNNNVTIEPAT